MHVGQRIMPPSSLLYDSLSNNEETPTIINCEKSQGRHRSAFNHFTKRLTRFWLDTITDIKKIRWKVLLVNFYYLILPILFLILLIFCMAYMASLKILDEYGGVCSVNGVVSDYLVYFNNQSQVYQPWKQSEMFTINLGFGSLDFASAKLIDIIWDLIIGRGGQVLLTVLSYRSLTNALSHLMVTQAVSYATFEALTLQHGSTTAFVKVVKDVSANSGLRAKMLLSWVLLSTTLLMAFPILTGAMTGYVASFVPQVQLPNNTYQPLSQFQMAYYIIHDGSRLGENYYNDYVVLDHHNGGPNLYQDYQCYAGAGNSEACSDCNKHAPTKVEHPGKPASLEWPRSFDNRTDCAVLWHTSEYVYKYGFNGNNKIDSTFNDSISGKLIYLPSPALNISTLLYNSYGDHEWIVPPFGLNDSSFLINASFYDYYCQYAFKTSGKDTIITRQELIDSLSCQQQDPRQSVRYQWGFSYQLLFTFVVLMFVWSSGTFVINMDVYFNSRSDVQSRRMGFRRAIIDISTEYADNSNSRYTAMDNEENLNKYIGKGDISYRHLFANGGNLTQWQQVKSWWTAYNFKRWVIDEWRWLSFLVIWTFLTCLSVVCWWMIYITDIMFGWLPVGGCMLVLIVGKRHPARWIVFFLSLVLFITSRLVYFTFYWQCIPSRWDLCLRMGEVPWK